MLVGLGALEGAEKFYTTECSTVVLTEDTDTSYLRVLLEANGAKVENLLIHSYKTSSKLRSAVELSRFINLVKPGVRVIIHRDRDFMTADDEARFMAWFPDNGKSFSVFVTEGSDVEHYFSKPEHISISAQLAIGEAEAIVDEIVEEHKVEFFNSFRSKRDQIKFDLYNDDRQNCKDTLKLYHEITTFQSSLGKDLLKKIAGKLQEKYGKNKGDLLVSSVALKDERLAKLISDLPKLEQGGGSWPNEIGKGAIYE
jgi:hypothetical protein